MMQETVSHKYPKGFTFIRPIICIKIKRIIKRLDLLKVEM